MRVENARNGGASSQIIVVGLVPKGGGVELLSWTLYDLARPGDTVVALCVSIPFSTLLTVERKTGDGAQLPRKGPAQLYLGELREICKNKQVQMDIKFSVDDMPEKVVVEHASAVNASTIVVGTPDRFVPWLKEIGGNYCVRNAPPGCKVFLVRNDKVMYFKDNLFKLLAGCDSFCSAEGMQFLNGKQLSADQNLEDVSFKASRSIKVKDKSRQAKCRNGVEQVDDCSTRGIHEGLSDLDVDSNRSSSFRSFSFTKKALTSHWERTNGAEKFRWRDFARLWKHNTMRRLNTFPPRAVPRNSAISWSSSTSDSINETSSRSQKCLRPDKDSPTSPLKMQPSWQCFTFQELQTATCNFSPENFLGKGGYAEVYKGILNGEPVAVKKLTRRQSEEQRVRDFLTEIGIIVHINHPNTARLIGFGVEGGLHLVFEFSMYGSLASMLHGSKSQLLDWNLRYKVALGTAEGLLYLHEGCQRRIIHRDIKASNILLTENFEPQISDFGLAKWLPKECTHLTITPIEGTFGHFAPEYFMHGIVDEKTDVFAFGVLLLELITGRLPIDSSQQSLVIWAKPLLESRNLEELIDPRLGNTYNVPQMNVMALAAALCIQHPAILRPSMRQVLQLLNGGGEDLESSDFWKVPVLNAPYLEVSLDAEEYTSTRYLTDLNRHREVALEF